MYFDLDEIEFKMLLLSLGIATGAMFQQGNRSLAYEIVKLTNKLNANNPQFQPYEIPAEFQAKRNR